MAIAAAHVGRCTLFCLCWGDIMARRKSLDVQFAGELDAYVSVLNTLTTEMTWTELAAESDLSVGCLRNLLDRVTKSSHARTLFKVGGAVGLDVSLVRDAKGRSKLKLVA